MSEYIITIKQLATVIKKCNGWPLEDKDGNPIVNPLEIDRDEVVELPEIVRCCDCKYADISYTHAAVTGELHCYGYLVESWDWYNDMPSDGVKVKPDGFCAWGERREE